MKPIASVIVATYDGEAFVREAIESVLAQDVELELLVCDDGSRDATVEVLGTFGERLRLLQQPNAGVASARNLAAGQARGEYVAFLDQDDAWEPHMLSTQIELLGSRPDCGFAYADSWVVDAAGRVRGRRGHELRFAEGWIFEPLLHGNFVPIETLVMRTELFRGLGGFREELGLLEDYDLVLRASRRSPAALTRDALARYRVHERNLTHDMQGILAEYARILAELPDLLQDLDDAERRAAARALDERYAELAWYALRRADVGDADRWMARARGPCSPALGRKIRLLRAALRVSPRPLGRALVGLLPGRRIHGIRAR